MAALPPTQVLLVEDDPASSRMIKHMLLQAEDAAFETTEATSLKAALQCIELKTFDLALLDLSLPDTHGYETVTEFSKATSLPFIVLTGNDDMQMAMRATRLGASDYLIKGEIKPKPLERAICMAIGKSNRDRSRAHDTYQTLTQFMPSDKATAAVLKPRVSRIIEAMEDMAGLVRSSAPGLSEDVQALFDKYNLHETIKETRDLMKEEAEETSPREGRKRRISDVALEALEDVSADSEPPEDWDAAEAYFDEVAARGAEHE